MSAQGWLDRAVRDNRDVSPQCLAAALWPLVGTADFAKCWLQERLARMAEHPADLPSGYADPVLQSLVMVDDGRVHLSLAIVSAAGWQSRVAQNPTGKAIIDFADGWTQLRFLIAEDACIQRHHRDTDDPARRAVADPPQRVLSGQEIVLANASEAVRFTHVGADVVMLRLVARDPEARRAIECDAHSGAVLRVRQAQAHEGRTRMTLSLLRSLGELEALGGIREGLTHWPPHLRWHGVMEALALDSRVGFGMLEAMVVNDPDPGLRGQAAQTRATLIARYPDLREAR